MLGSIFLQTENRGESQTHLTSKNFLWFPPNTDDTLQTIWQRRAALRVRLGSGPCCFSRTGCRHLCSALGHAHFAQNSLACCSQSSAGSASTIHKLSLTKTSASYRSSSSNPFPALAQTITRITVTSKVESVPALTSLRLHLSGYFWD